MSAGQPAILVVEDNPDDVLLLQRAFGKANLINPVHVVSDGQALQLYWMILNERPDIRNG